MIDRNVQMMDAGMVLFTSEKPFGTVLGGIKTEMAKLGNVRRSNEFALSELPDTTGECDLFVDWSTALRWRAISCRLEDAGLVGHNSDGEEIRRYALCLKEGDKNRKGKVAVVFLFAAMLITLGVTGVSGVPVFLTAPIGIALAALAVFFGLRPSVKAQNAVRNLLETARGAK